jgi:hypothetical protein
MARTKAETEQGAAPVTGALVAFPGVARRGVSDAVLAAAEERLRVAKTARDQLGVQVEAARAACEAATGKPGHGAARYEWAVAAWDRASERVAEAAERVERLHQTRDQASALAQREQELRARFEAEYGNLALGPGYDVLITRAVRAELRAELLETSGRDVDTGEARKAHASVLDAIAALQRYAAGQAAQARIMERERHQAAIGVLEFFGRIIAPRAPELWRDAISALDERLAQGEARG